MKRMPNRPPGMLKLRTRPANLSSASFLRCRLFVFSMARDFGLIGAWSHAAWVNWFFWALATPVQFYTGWDYYAGGFKSLRNKSANMDVLVAMGSSVAYFYSLAVLFFPALGGHVYFETSAVIITLIKLGKMLESRTKGRTGGAIRKLIGLRPKTATIVENGYRKRDPLDPGQSRQIRCWSVRANGFRWTASSWKGNRLWMNPC